jgi:hypothetical protein
MNHEQNMAAVKTTATINLLAGIWLFISPWVYRTYMVSNAWNSWIVGALIVVFAASRLYNPMIRGLGVVNLVLGAWTFASPWIYGYTGDTSRFVNSLCVGVVVFVLSIYGSSVEMGHPTAPPPMRTS